MFASRERFPSTAHRQRLVEEAVSSVVVAHAAEDQPEAVQRLGDALLISSSRRVARVPDTVRRLARSLRP